jgi:metallo-beta-lactamase class B
MNDILRRSRRAWILLALTAACASAPESRTSTGSPKGSGVSSKPETTGQSEYVLSEDVSVRRLAPGVWLHTTLSGEDFGHYPANGLLVEDGEGTLLVDAGWNPQHAERLVAWAQEELHRPVRAAVATHFHSDRLGGAQALLARGLPVYGLQETARLAAAQQRPGPSRTFAEQQRLGPIELFFPGAGHSPDNIVVWHPESAVLFGGCFIKDAAAKDLGNVGDADIAAWPASLNRTREHFPQMRIVVPGHGLPGGSELLTHTQELLSATKAPR